MVGFRFGLYASSCQIPLRALYPLSRNVDFLHFLNNGRPPSWIFKNSNFLTANWVWQGQYVSPWQIPWQWSNQCRDMAIFRFIKMAAVRRRGFVMRTFGPPKKSTWWSLWLCNIWLELSMQFWRYANFSVMWVWLENVYSRPFLESFRGKIVASGNFFQFYSSKNATIWDWHLMNQTM